VPQVRQIVTRLLLRPHPTARDIATEISAVLRRTEESRIYHWQQTTGDYPPSRRRETS
jgi:hypothetical protein